MVAPFFVAFIFVQASAAGIFSLLFVAFIFSALVGSAPDLPELHIFLSPFPVNSKGGTTAKCADRTQATNERGNQ